MYFKRKTKKEKIKEAMHWSRNLVENTNKDLPLFDKEKAEKVLKWLEKEEKEKKGVKS